MHINRRHLLMTSLIAGAASTLGINQLSPLQAKTPLADRLLPALHRYKVGAYEVTSLQDGVLSLDLGLFTNLDKPEAEQLLESNMQSKEKPFSSLNVYLINTGNQLIMVDTGGGALLGPTVGRLINALQMAGVQPADIDVVLLTHFHGDHIGGLTNAQGEMVFPNAEIVYNKREADYWLDEGAMSRAPEGAKPYFLIAQKQLKPYIQAKKARIIEPGTNIASNEIYPGIMAVLALGHTPGHTMFMVSSNGETLLIWGDLIHNATLQFAHPDYAISFDSDQTQAIATRRQVFEMAASEKSKIAGMHLPFPALGYVARNNDSYRFVPAFWS